MEFQIDVSGPLAGLAELEKFPKSGLKRVMRQAANVIKGEVQAIAPYETGMLANAIVLKEEKSRTPYKTSFRVTLRSDPAFVKMVNGKRYFYPASQEYGWTLRNGEQVPGKHYMKYGGDLTSEEVKQMIVDEFDKVIDGVMNGTLSATGARVRNSG
jgi:hypothetical protein